MYIDRLKSKLRVVKLLLFRKKYTEKKGWLNSSNTCPAKDGKEYE